MNKLELRKTLKRFKPFLNKLRTENRRQRTLRKSSEDQLNCLGHLLREIANGSIPIDREVESLLRKKKKLTYFGNHFGSEEASLRFQGASKENKIEILLHISLVLPALINTVFK